MWLNDRKNLFDQVDAEFIMHMAVEPIHVNYAYYNADCWADITMGRIKELFPEAYNGTSIHPLKMCL